MVEKSFKYKIILHINGSQILIIQEIENYWVTNCLLKSKLKTIKTVFVNVAQVLNHKTINKKNHKIAMLLCNCGLLQISSINAM